MKPDFFGDRVNPPHYTRLTPQPIEVIEGWQLGAHEANVIKYVARAGRKSGESQLSDLRKALWYLNRKIERIEKESKPIPVAHVAQ